MTTMMLLVVKGAKTIIINLLHIPEDVKENICNKERHELHRIKGNKIFRGEKYLN